MKILTKIIEMNRQQTSKIQNRATVKVALQNLHRRKQRKAKSVEKFTKIWYNDINKTTKGRRYYVFIRLL